MIEAFPSPLELKGVSGENIMNEGRRLLIQA